MNPRHLLIAAAVLPAAVCCLAGPPVVSRISPLGIVPGKTTEIILEGDNLEGATILWTSFPSSLEPNSGKNSNSNTSERVSFRVAVPAGTSPGVGALRLATTNGISDLRLCFLDDLASSPDTVTNRTLATAQEVAIPAAIDGFCEEMGFHYYKLHARKNETIAIEVVAQRMGSRLDPLLRLLDSRGRELVYCDDEPGIGSDARIRHRFAAEGDYFIELRDSTYQGSSQHRFHLRVGGSPVSTSAFPLGQKVRALGFEFPNAKTFPSVEPNDTQAQATRVTLPAILNGRFEKANDRDCFEFVAEKKQQIVFRGRTRSLGSPCDLYLQIEKADGTRIADSKINGADDGTLTNTFAEAGTYFLVVEELNRRGGRDFSYRVDVEPIQPGFALSVETDKINVAPGESVELKVTCLRRDYTGSITLSIENPDPGITLENAEIPAGKMETLLKVGASAQAARGEAHRVQLVGHAKIGEVEFATLVSTLPALQKAFPQMIYPPLEFDGWLSLGVGETVSIDNKPPPKKKK